MKFDKIMEIGFRILAVITACVVFLGCVVSCHSVNARALEPIDIAFEVQDFLSTYEENLITITQAVATDIQNGNLDYTSQVGRQVLSALAAQRVFSARLADPNVFGDLVTVLGTEELEVAWNNIPDTVLIKGSGASGLCLYGGEYYPVTMYTGVPTLAESPVFKIILEPGSTDAKNYRFGVPSTIPQYCYGNWLGNPDSYQFYITLYDKNGNEVSHSGKFSGWTFVKYSTNSIPSAPASNVGYYAPYDGSTPSRSCCGYAQEAILTNENISKNEPWNYYNNTLLPSFTGIDSRYIVFPDGYYPNTPDPTEPATFPNGGITINQNNTNFNIGVNIFVPTDSNGQPITDTMGETVTETAYITDTSPIDGQYNFEMPTLPSLIVPQETIPPPRISDFSDGLNFIWNSTTNILEESGFLPVVICILSLCVLGYILWHIGG